MDIERLEKRGILERSGGLVRFIPRGAAIQMWEERPIAEIVNDGDADFMDYAAYDLHGHKHYIRKTYRSLE